VKELKEMSYGCQVRVPYGAVAPKPEKTEKEKEKEKEKENENENF